MKVEKIKTYRDLIAWQRAMELVRLLYQVTARMPESERFGLTNQMRRAAVSIPSNIAEGYARQTTLDYIKFLRTARGSLAELATQVEIAIAIKMFVPHAQLKTLLVMEAGINPANLISILHYDGTPITARFITKEIAEIVSALNIRPIKKDKAA